MKIQVKFRKLSYKTELTKNSLLEKVFIKFCSVIFTANYQTFAQRSPIHTPVPDMTASQSMPSYEQPIHTPVPNMAASHSMPSYAQPGPVHTPLPNITASHSMPTLNQYHQPEMYHGNYTPDYQRYYDYSATSQPSCYGYGSYDNRTYYQQNPQNFGYFPSQQPYNSNFQQPF